VHGGRQVTRKEKAERIVVYTYLFKSAWSMRIGFIVWSIPFLSDVDAGMNVQVVRSVD